MKPAQFTREVWWPVRDYETRYHVSNLGRVRSLGNAKRPKPRVLKCSPSKQGYRFATLYNGAPGRTSGRKIKVAVLVLETFRGPPPTPGMDSCHRDGNSLNDSLGNLRWGTRAENVQDARRHGTHPAGERHGQRILSDATVAEIRRRLVRERGKDLAREFGVSAATVSAIWNNQRRATQ